MNIMFCMCHNVQRTNGTEIENFVINFEISSAFSEEQQKPLLLFTHCKHRFIVTVPVKTRYSTEGPLHWTVPQPEVPNKGLLLSQKIPFVSYILTMITLKLS